MHTAALVPNQCDAIVFDVIGTLVDEDETWARVAGRLAAEAGVDEAAGLRTRWVELLDRHMNAVVHGDTPWRPHRELVSDSAREAITSLGGTSSPEAIGSPPYLASRCGTV